MAHLNVTLPGSVTFLATVTPWVQRAGLSNLQAIQLDNVRIPAASRLLQLLERPVLRALELGLATCRVQALPEVFAAVGAATQLTRLVLKGEPFEPERGDPLPLVQLGGLRISTHLSKLVGLQILRISYFDLSPSDLMGLSSLTQLTALCLSFAEHVGDVAVAVTASRLSQLRVLFVLGCGLTSPDLWPAYAALTNLTTLCMIIGGPELTDEALQQLRPLTQLETLEVDAAANKTTKEGLTGFLEVMPALEAVTFAD